MRITYLYGSLSKRGGTERILIQKMNWLADVMGYEVSVITNQQNNEDYGFPLSPKVNHIDVDVHLWKKYNTPLPARLWVEHKLLKEYRNKVLQELYTIDPDIIICCHDPFPGLICSLQIRAKKIVEAHNPRNIVTYQRGFLSFYLEKFFWMKEIRKAERLCDSIVSLTKGDSLCWKNAKRVEIIPDMVEPFNKVDYPIQSKKIVTFGRFVSQKGYDLLIEAWRTVNKSHPDWKLYIYGEGEQEDFFKRKISEYGLNRSVSICPFTHDVYKILIESSFLVCSSRYEGFGMTLVEAMMVGRPCVSFKCPYGPEDIIENGYNGLLVENGNVSALSSAICGMIEDESLRNEMANNASLSAKKYHPNVIMPKWLALFESLLN